MCTPESESPDVTCPPPHDSLRLPTLHSVKTALNTEPGIFARINIHTSVSQRDMPPYTDVPAQVPQYFHTHPHETLLGTQRVSNPAARKDLAARTWGMFYSLSKCARRFQGSKPRLQEASGAAHMNTRTPESPNVTCPSTLTSQRDSLTLYILTPERVTIIPCTPEAPNVTCPPTLTSQRALYTLTPERVTLYTAHT